MSKKTLLGLLLIIPFLALLWCGHDLLDPQFILLRPAYSQNALQGKTLDEVTQSLGAPNYDSKDKYFNSSDGQRRLLDYTSGHAICHIMFLNGKVESVARFVQ
jgi:hypothetical protein